MPHDPYRALYLHIPFCASRCGYCDFTTRACAADDRRMDEYVERLVLELRRKAKEGELAAIDTVYLGGGTPTHLGHGRLSSLLYALSLSMDLTREGLEFTVEANPESLDERLVKDIWALGANRLSLGVQSFDDEVLQRLGRPHTACEALDAVAAARERFQNVSLDLMCGIPGQSRESLEESLQQAVALGVPHISVYPLTIEPGTPFDRAVMAGLMDSVDDDAQADHMLLAQQVLQQAGYRRYEVASYALPGFECRHNEAYWTGVPYLGLGEAAATMTQNAERRMRVTDGRVTDDLDRPRMEAEDLMLAMRMADGVSEERLAQAAEFLPDAPAAMESLVADGYAVREDGRWRPTEAGWLCGNDLYGRLFDLGEGR